MKEILRIGTQAAQALVAAHAQGVVHRDIKPANILLENCIEQVKLTDFGLARTIDDASLTQSGIIAGTPQYMAPEQARGESVDARSDLFSLGAVLYAMAGGRPPFRADSALAVLKRICDDRHRSIRELNPEHPRLAGSCNRPPARQGSGRSLPVRRRGCRPAGARARSRPAAEGRSPPVRSRRYRAVVPEPGI